MIKIFLALLTSTQAGFLRDMVKERIKSKLENEPAPIADSIAPNTQLKSGEYTFSLEVDGHIRWYKLHVPKNYSSATATPLLLALHGGIGDMNIQSEDKFYKQISVSDRENYVVAFPNGYSQFKSGKIATWNAGACCGKARDEKIDDVKFIKAVIANIKSHLNIDNKKIYADGMSNGAMLSYRLACEMPEELAGIATVAGTDNTLECHPKKAINIFHIHAKNDDHVLFNGGKGPAALSDVAETDFKSVPDTIEKWKKFNHCPPTPKRVLENSDVYCDLYSPCKDDTEIKLCVTTDGKHSWPGGEKPRGGSASSKAISATDEIWKFFAGK